MSTFIVIGWKSLNAHPECLYIGSDGVAASQAGVDARESGKYARLGKLVNPTMIPLPPVPFPKADAPSAIVSTPADAMNPQPKKKNR